MSMHFCRRCQVHHFLGDKCLPGFTIWTPEYGEEEDDAQEVRGHGLEDAIERWAIRHDSESAEYDIVGQHNAPIVHTRIDGEVRRFKVTGEAVPTYFVHEVPA